MVRQGAGNAAGWASLRAGGKPFRRPFAKRGVPGEITRAMLRRFFLLASLAVCSFTAPAAENPAPAELTAADILHAVRAGQSGRHEALDGQLRDDSNDKIYPFRLVADGPLVRYQFGGKPPETVQVRYNVDNSTLEESGPDGGKMTPANFDKKILGTDLTYEDLSLRFIYWSQAAIEGDDRLMTLTRPAWRLRLQSPAKRSQYASVLLWVDKESGALLQAEGYDEQGKLSRRFKVISGQQLEGKWYLKQMRIESFDVGSDHVRTRTYLEIKGLAK